MAFILSQFATLRPYVFHMTATENLEHIRQRRALTCAARLYDLAGAARPMEPRRACVRLRVGDVLVIVRDQGPLHRGNIELRGGWDFQDVLADLNGRVFFWAGTERGPSAYGLRYFERYRSEGLAVLRVRCEELLAANAGRRPEFCRYNSGSPRCSGGAKSPRGPETFAAAEAADFTAGKVVEVTYADKAKLPARVDVGASPTGPWRSVYGNVRGAPS